MNQTKAKLFVKHGTNGSGFTYNPRPLGNLGEVVESKEKPRKVGKKARREGRKEG